MQNGIAYEPPSGETSPGIDFEYTKPVTLSLLLSMLAFVLTNVLELYQYQFITVMWLVPSFGLYMLWFVDKVILKNSNTYVEIVENENVAYAIWMLCFTLLILAGVAAAFLLYFSLVIGK